jgi:hypothetical protein
MALKLLIPVPAPHKANQIWEEVGEGLWRTIVEGGLLYRAVERTGSGAVSVALQFVPTKSRIAPR